jgi:general secretion pathway protein D
MNIIPRTLRGKRGWAIVACLLASAAAIPALGQGPPVVRTAANAPAGAAAATMQAYPIFGAAAKGVAAKLKELYAGRTDAQFADTTAGHVVVIAPPNVQNEVVSWLGAQGLVAPQAEVPPRPAQAPSQPQRVVTQSWQLHNLTAKDFESKLTKTWGLNLQSSHDPVGDVATFRFPPTAAGATSIVVDRRTNTATVASPASSARSWQRLMTILDSRPGSANERTTVIPVVKSDPSTIRRAVSLLQQVFASADTRRKQHIGQFVSMLFQQEPGAAQPAAPAAPAAPPAGETTSQAVPSGAASAASMEAIARINNVQIEILDDVIVVRGRREDVDRVLEIIAQIEQQSLQFKPEIELHYLKHIDSTALSEMINQVYAAAFARQGTVTVVPLQRPNAVLLIGRKENIPSIIELIAKLDLPAPTEGEFKIFHLQHMSAIDAERTVRGFFVSRPPTDQTLRQGLGTRALVIADYRSNSLIVQAAPRDLLEVTRLVESLDVPESTASYEIKVFKLRNSIATTLATSLEEAITAAQATTTATAVTGAAGQATPARATPPAVSLQFLRVGPGGEEVVKSGIMANVRVTADTRSNTLIVVAPANSMNLMAALIERLDQLPASEAQIKVFSLRNGDATALADMLTNLFGVPQQAAQAGQQVGAVTPTGQGESAIVPLRFSVDQRTNSIIASGNAGDLNVIYYILTRLDEGDVRQRETKVYRLKNAPAQDVANALTQLLQQQVLLIQSAPELITPVEQIEQQVIVVPEVVTNTLIISATSRQLARVKEILDTLDRRPPMVVIQVVIAEVTLQDNEAFGVEWGLQDALMFDRSSSATGNRFNFNSNPLTLPNDPGATSLATATKVATQAVSNLTLGRNDPTLGFGGLVLTASSESVSVLLRALEQSQRAQIISRPQVQTLDNQIAFVQVGQSVPRIQGSTITQFGVSNQVTDVQVGLILQVQPRTSPDGLIVMQVNATKSSVASEVTGIPVAVDQNGNVIRSPRIDLTTAQTTVSARTGQTIILGGLITKDLEETTRRIPYLADIPVLGRLFRFDTASNKRTELLIIMTPYVVQTPEQVDWINARESERMSWCLADLVNIHGPIPSMSGSPLFNPAATPLIFPDLQPGAYPAGPAPYSSPEPLPQGTPTPAGTSPAAPPLPGGYPVGPPPYTAPPGPAPATAPSPAPIPATPPPGPRLGSQPDGGPPSYVIPQPPSLIQPTGAMYPGPLAPPPFEPALPPPASPGGPPVVQRLPFAEPIPGANLPAGPPPIAPAAFQQPPVR